MSYSPRTVPDFSTGRSLDSRNRRPVSIVLACLAIWVFARLTVLVVSKRNANRLKIISK